MKKMALTILKHRLYLLTEFMREKNRSLVSSDNVVSYFKILSYQIITD